MDRRHFINSTATGSIALVAANRNPLLADGTPEMKEVIRVPKSKVLIVVGDATETVDTLYPYYRLIEAGFQPVVTAPEKRLYQMVLHEVKPGWTITKEWEGYSINADIAFKDIQPEEYVGIFFSGGRAPEYIREDEDLLRITRWFWDNKRPMASVCHGVEIPARAGIVKGLRMATVAKCKFDLEVCGGIYVNEPCVIDRHMVSGRTYHDNGHFVGPWIEMLNAACANNKATNQ
jgi:protease I